MSFELYYCIHCLTVGFFVWKQLQYSNYILVRIAPDWQKNFDFMIVLSSFVFETKLASLSLRAWIGLKHKVRLEKGFNEAPKNDLDIIDGEKVTIIRYTNLSKWYVL